MKDLYDAEFKNWLVKMCQLLQNRAVIYIGRYRTVSKYLKQNHSGLSNSTAHMKIRTMYCSVNLYFSDSENAYDIWCTPKSMQRISAHRQKEVSANYRFNFENICMSSGL
jgi:hypothetical protein